MEKYLDTKNGYKEENLKEIANTIKNGGLVLFPTETVYGIGTNGLNANAVEKLYKVKKRSLKNPINLLVSDIKMVEKITNKISHVEYELMKAFFPGPFTLILQKNDIVPQIVTANSNYVGVRMPNHKIAIKLVEFAGVPVAAPSANVSGELSATDFNDIIDKFSNSLDFAIDGGKTNIGIESTIVKVIDEVPHILRPGSITPEQIKHVAGNVVLEENHNSNLPSSDMAHYQLNIPSILVFDENNKEMINKILNLCRNYKKPVIVSSTENTEYYSNMQVVNVASRYNLEDYSKNLFSSLRKAVSFNPDIVLIEGVKNEGLGIAIMNRLKNVCNEIYVEI